MSLLSELASRNNDSCELCSSNDNLSVYSVAPRLDESIENSIAVCQSCRGELDTPSNLDPNHWRCLNESMWSEVSAVKVLAYRLLNKLSLEGWPKDLLDMMYLSEDELVWANYDEAGDVIEHRDSNGAILQNGDSVTIIKALDVKGANFTAKRGTAVRNIRLVADNDEHIEGKIEGQKIVILTRFVKKL